MTAADVAASFNKIIFPAEGSLSARSSNYLMVDKVEAPDPNTVVFDLKFATSAFLPALADPFNFIYRKAILDKDPRWYQKNVLGSGPFKFVDYQVGQSIKGEKNADYYHRGCPIWIALPASMPTSRRCGSRQSAATGPLSNSAACPRPRATNWSRR
jgi:peptide/nickel transport system substrate-binding protein